MTAATPSGEIPAETKIGYAVAINNTDKLEALGIIKPNTFPIR